MRIHTLKFLLNWPFNGVTSRVVRFAKIDRLGSNIYTNQMPSCCRPVGVKAQDKTQLTDARDNYPLDLIHQFQSSIPKGRYSDSPGHNLTLNPTPATSTNPKMNNSQMYPKCKSEP